MRSLLLVFALLGTGCSSYVSKMHDQIDQEAPERYRPPKDDQFSLYRGQRRPAGQNPQGPRSLSRPDQPRSSQTRSVRPGVKRRYDNSKKRTQSEDLVDQGNPGSLWAADEQNSFLFSKNNKKRPGDIVVLQVMKGLKNQIAAELARAFPQRQRPEEEQDEQGKGEGEEEEEEEQQQPARETAAQDAPNKIFDKISSVVIEEIHNGHLLIRGRKDILFRKSKRTIEIQAMVRRRDITDNDTVPSTSVLESNVVVLR